MSDFSKKIQEGLEDILAYQKKELDLRTTTIEIAEHVEEFSIDAKKE